MVRSILGFFGFGRSARLARMARKAHARTLRMYGPAFGFYPVEFLHFRDDAGNVRGDRYETPNANRNWNCVFYSFHRRARPVRPAPYRAGWGIVPTFDAVPRPYPYADAFV